MHKFIGPLNILGGGAIITYFNDPVSTNILLAMFGFPLSQKRHADFFFKPSGLFFFIYSEFDFSFFDDLQLQIIASIFPIAPVVNSSYFFYST